MKTILKLKLSLFLVAIIMSFFVSCSNENNANSFDSSNKIKENLINYIAKRDKIFTEIDLELNRNEKFKFDSNIISLLNSSDTEKKFTEVILNSNIKNSNLILALLKESVYNENEFRTNNPMFYKLSIEDRTSYLNNSIDLHLKTKEISLANKITSCAGDYNTDIGRCNRDALISSSASIIAAGAGILPGLIAAAYTMISHHNCVSDAKEDYQSCL